MSAEASTKRTTLHPYLSFTGKAGEAMDFYAEHLGGEVTVKMLYSQGPPPTIEEFKDCVMHGSMSFDGHTIMFSDVVGENCAGSAPVVGTNVTININWTDVTIMTKSFEGLSADGVITMPLAHQFWGATYGSFIDKFGIPWSFNCQDECHEQGEKKQRVD